MFWLPSVANYAVLPTSSFDNQTQTPYFWLQLIGFRTSDPVQPITRITDLLIKQTQISFFRTSNRLEHPMFGFKQMDIEHQI